MPTHALRLASIIVLGLGVVLLAACQPQNGRATLPTLPPPTLAPETTDPAISPTAGASSTLSPLAAEAVAAMERYIETANRAAVGINIEAMRPLFSDSCGLCLDSYNDFLEAERRGWEVSGTMYQNHEVFVDRVDAEQVVIRTVIDLGEMTVIDPVTNELTRYPSEQNVSSAWTLRVRQSGNWVIIQGLDL